MNQSDEILKGAFIAAVKTLSKSETAATHLRNQTLPIVISVNENRIYQLPHLKITVRLSPAESNGEYEIYDEITDVGSGSPLHTHTKQWEVLEVLEGKYLFKANEELFEATPGSMVIVPPNTPHCFLNVHTAPSKLRFILTPGLNFEGFLQEMSALTGEPNPAEMVPLLQKYDMMLLGPPMHL